MRNYLAIRKVLAASLLNLPEAPSVDEKCEEISQRRTSKLTVGCIKLPFPEELESSSWMKEVVYLPEITISNLKDYAQKSQSQKGFIEGINLHNAKHVSHVEFNNISDCVDYCFIRGEVVPQTRVRESPYRVWVCVNSSTCQMLTGECACIAGYGESCKHVFALLHFVENKVALGLNKTSTSKKQAWQETVSKKGEKLHPPTNMSQVSFERPHPEREHTYEKPCRNTFDPRSVKERNAVIDWENLSVASKGTSSVLCFKNKIKTSSDLQSETLKSQPWTLETIASSSSSPDNFNALLKEQRTQESISKIETLTTGQSSNNLWFDYRCGVITASVAHEVLCKYRKKNPTASSIQNLVGKILGYEKPLRTASLSWGIENEAVARKRYVRQNKSSHKHLKCYESGLKLHPEMVMLGASVDGMVECSCCGDRCLEIKCPFSHREKTVEEYVQQPDSCLENSLSTDTKYRLKPGHKYYTQVQHQLFITGSASADFVVYLPKESCTVSVTKETSYSEVSVPLLVDFFQHHLLPDLLGRDILKKYICKEILCEIVKNATNIVDNKKVQKKLDSLASGVTNSSTVHLPAKKSKKT